MDLDKHYGTLEYEHHYGGAAENPKVPSMANHIYQAAAKFLLFVVSTFGTICRNLSDLQDAWQDT